MNEIRYGAPIINACFGKNNDNPSELTLEDFEAAIAILVTNDYKTALQQDTLIEQKYGWVPITDYYFAFVPESLIPKIRSLPILIPSPLYPQQKYILKNEIGCLVNTRIIQCDDNAMIRDDQRSISDNRIYWIDFCNDPKGHSLLRLRCTLDKNATEKQP